jgi:transglutaminase-like putative cysteine protease
MQESLVFTTGNVGETGRYMREMVDKYYKDMVLYASYSLPEVFDIIKSIPYRDDHPDAEVLMRPLYTLQQRGYGGDCDCKAIALASYCMLVGIPFRFVAVRQFDKKQLHHVYLQLYLYNEWIVADPTYGFNVLGREREPYAERVII